MCSHGRKWSLPQRWMNCMELMAPRKKTVGTTKAWTASHLCQGWRSWRSDVYRCVQCTSRRNDRRWSECLKIKDKTTVIHFPKQLEGFDVAFWWYFCTWRWKSDRPRESWPLQVGPLLDATPCSEQRLWQLHSPRWHRRPRPKHWKSQSPSRLPSPESSPQQYLVVVFLAPHGWQAGQRRRLWGQKPRRATLASWRSKGVCCSFTVALGGTRWH